LLVKPGFTTLAVEDRGVVCEVTLTRDRINVAMVRELDELCAWLDDECASSVVVFRGTTSRFTRGIDLGDFSLQRPPDIHGFGKWERALSAIERLKKVTVAAIEGECRGGGVQLALACDARIASSSAVFAVDEVKNGFLPGMATWRLAKYLGMGRARWLILTGQEMTADQALAAGLLGAVCNPGEVEGVIERTVMAFLPVNGTVVALARRLLLEGYAKSHEDFLGDFLAAQHRAISGESFMRRVQEEALRPPPP
jgi:enoyl-CoA hydratase/carnithine racemase